MTLSPDDLHFWSALPQKIFIESVIKLVCNGDIVNFQAILETDSLKYRMDVSALSNSLFCRAAENGHLSMVRYLLNHPALTPHIDIHDQEDYAFRLACRNGHLDVVCCLLTSPELSKNADIHAKSDEAIRMACLNGHLNVVTYLLSSQELTEHADIHAENDEAYLHACDFCNEHIMHYLLTLDGDKAIDFQSTEYNIEWAMNYGYVDITRVMMLSLKKREPVEYMIYLPQFKAYCIDNDCMHYYVDVENQDSEIIVYSNEISLY